MIEMYNEGRPIQTIGCALGVSRQTVMRRLDDHGFDKKVRKQMRDDSKQYSNKAWLHCQYHVLEKSISQIARDIGVSHCAIAKRMKQFGITQRTQIESARLRANHFTAIDGFNSFMNGLLLGDGCVCAPSTVSAHYEHSSKHLHYLEDLKGRLSSFGIQTQAKIRKKSGITKGHEFTGYSLTTLSYAELLPIREKWYPNGEKILPDDIELTPTTCLHWYLGDGGLKHPQRGGPSIKLSTHCFMKKDVLRLIDKLGKLGISANYRPSNNCIGIGVRDTPKFLNLIGPCPKGAFSSYGYRFDLERSKAQWEAEFAIS